MKLDKNMKEAVYFLVVYGVILASWVPMMDYFKASVVPTAAVGLVIFVGTSKLMQKIMNLR